MKNLKKLLKKFGNFDKISVARAYFFFGKYTDKETVSILIGKKYQQKPLIILINTLNEGLSDLQDFDF